jgi:hypothetical protein
MSDTKVTYIASVKADCPFRAKTARAAWWTLAKEYEGKPAAEFLQAAKANPPSYHVRGKNAGQPEDPMEWLLWMAGPKVGALTLETR